MFRVFVASLYFVDKGAITFLNLKSLVTLNGHVGYKKSIWKIVNFRNKNAECQNFFQSWWIKSKKNLIPFLLSLSLSLYIYIYIYIYVCVCVCVCVCGLGSSVGIATELRAGQSWIESRWGRDFPPVQTGPGANTNSCRMGTGSFPGGKVRPGRAADHSPPSSAAVMEE